MTNTNTYRGVCIALGVGLAILWVAGLSSPTAPGWLTWLDGAGALAAFIVSGSLQSYDTRQKKMGGPITLAIGLYGLWIIGLATGAVSWMAWWTFAFACAFLVFGVTAGGTRTFPESTEMPQENEEDRIRHDKYHDEYKKTG